MADDVAKEVTSIAGVCSLFFFFMFPAYHDKRYMIGILQILVVFVREEEKVCV